MSIARYAHIAQRMFNRPVALEQDKAVEILVALSDRLGIKAIEVDGTEMGQAEMDRIASVSLRSERRDRKLFHTRDNVAVIPVSGTLFHKYGHLDPYSGATGYDGIGLKLDAAMADDEVKAIWLDIDSPGGEVAGCFDLADKIHAYSKRGNPKNGKRIWAMVNEWSASAAYANASQADKVIIPRTGGCGSIGVLMMHVSYQGMLADDGIKVTPVFSGKHKVDGNPYEDLPEAVKERWQTMIDKDRKLFAQTVARGRRMAVRNVMATEAQVYFGQDAVDVGLADVVASEEQAWDAMQRLIKRA